MPANEILKKFRPYHINGLKRLGNKYDGGYVVHYPSLTDAEYLINYGVGYNVAFEKAYFKATGKPTLAFDPTLSIGDLWSLIRADMTNDFVYVMRQIKKYISWKVTMFTLANHKIKFVSEGIAAENTALYKTFEYHYHQYHLSDKKFILKMDIEGWEYPVFNDNSFYSFINNAVQILIEFHFLDTKIEELAGIITRLDATHTLIHIHANNAMGTFNYNGKIVPQYIEATFILNAYIADKKHSDKHYPIKDMDHPCIKNREDIVLDFFY